jgi:hypothetical protein
MDNAICFSLVFMTHSTANNVLDSGTVLLRNILCNCEHLSLCNCEHLICAVLNTFGGIFIKWVRLPYTQGCETWIVAAVLTKGLAAVPGATI